MKYILLFLFFFLFSCTSGQGKQTHVWLVSETDSVSVWSIKDDTIRFASKIPRGAEIVCYEGESVTLDTVKYEKINAEEALYVKSDYLSSLDSLLAREKTVYVKIPASVISDTVSSEISTLVNKGQALDVIDYDSIECSGQVHRYKVKIADSVGFIYGKYVSSSKEEALKPYMYNPKHDKVKNSFGAGKANGCDFSPVQKNIFPKHKIPEKCCALYLNISPYVLGKIDKYIDLAKTTHINTFVIDLKDDSAPGYKAEAMQKFSPTSWKNAGSKKEKLYTEVVEKLHKSGFWVVGRITCFKDKYFIDDNPSSAISDKSTGEPFLHNKSYWPSAYDRRVWQYNVSLAKESVRKFGLDEINFDYVRFPDRMSSVKDQVDLHNKYNESKVQAIQRFVQYACDELHSINTYVSIDVFGETANPGYTTAYGQYWPAISNVADVICGMPYPDHFSNNYYGIEKPWNHPYEILNAWGKRVMDRQAMIPTPAKVRTWIQCYHVMRFVDPDGIDYNAENVEKEIRGLLDAGLRDGYITWNSGSSLDKYTDISDAFRIDYWSEK